MFIGEFHHTLDEKGRVAVPKKFREALKNGAVVTSGLDGCLYLYSGEQWQKEAEKYAALPGSQGNVRAHMRFTLAGAMDVEPDKQGRIMLPEYLRAFACLKKNVVVAGLYNRLEVWDEELWEAYRQKAEQESVKIAEQLGEFGV